MLFNLAALGLLLTGVLATDITPDFDSIHQPTKGQVAEAGSTVEIASTINNTANYGDAKVDVQVICGKDPGTLAPKDTIATGIDNSHLKYKWHVKKSLGDEKLYGIKIVLNSDESVLAYSPGFSIKKAEDVDSGTDSSTNSSTESTTSTGTTTMTATTESDSAATSTTKTSAAKKTTTSTSKSETDSSTTTPTPTTDASSTTVTTTPLGTPSNAAVGGPKTVPGMVAAAVGCVAMMAI